MTSDKVNGHILTSQSISLDYLEGNDRSNNAHCTGQSHKIGEIAMAQKDRVSLSSTALLLLISSISVISGQSSGEYVVYFCD